MYKFVRSFKSNKRIKKEEARKSSNKEEDNNQSEKSNDSASTSTSSNDQKPNRKPFLTIKSSRSFSSKFQSNSEDKSNKFQI